MKAWGWVLVGVGATLALLVIGAELAWHRMFLRLLGGQ